jgi:hypothetical protein
MTTEPSQRSSSGGDALLTVVGITTIVVAGLEALFVPWATWTLLALLLVTLILAAIGVVWSVARLIDDDRGTARAPRPEPQPEPAPVPRTATRPVLGH